MRRIKYFFRGRLFPLALFAVLLVAGGIFLAVKLPRLLAPVAAAERIFSFVAACVLLASDELSEEKTAKLVLIAFLPYLGAAAVLFFAKRCPPLGAIPEGGDPFTRIARLTFRTTGLTPRTAASVTYFATGEEFEKPFLADLSRAKERIWLEYYIVARGAFFDGILRILEEKARAGADVRLIYDDFGCGLTLPARFPRELAKRGIRAAVFSPLKPRRGFSRRDHRKIAVLDGVAYTGGINLSDEYVGKRIRFGHWKDTAVRIEGDASAFSELFLRTWYALFPSEAKKEPTLSEKTYKTQYLTVSDGAEGGRLAPSVLSILFSAAQKEILLFTPYLALPSPLFFALTQAAARGVEVKVMIPKIPDKKSVYLITTAYAEALSAAGVDVRTYTDGFLHAKSAVIDGKYAFVSSYNLDFRSMYRQAECGALFSDAELAAALEKDFFGCYRQGSPLKRSKPAARAFRRLLTIFAPLV